MSTIYRVGVIGAGRPWKSEGATGFGMAHHHVKGFLATGRCELAAVADISRKNAEAFVQQYGGRAAIYEDYRAMLAEAKPDIVSVCTWPHLHAPMVLAAAEARVRAIHCEKPMAVTWGEARRMHQAAVANGVMLTFNHQRRFNAPFQKARELLADGAVGPLLRIEGQCDNIYDWGTHWLDMFFFYNNETPAEWVIGQIDAREEKRIFGAPVEQQSICHFKFQNEVRGLLICGFEASIGCANRLIGQEGVMEIGWQSPWLRLRRDTAAGWQEVEVTDGIHDPVAHDRAAADIVRCLDTGERPLLSSHHAIQATEVIFATYESCRQRGRIDLPLTADDAGLVTLLEQGIVGPGARRDC